MCHFVVNEALLYERESLKELQEKHEEVEELYRDLVLECQRAARPAVLIRAGNGNYVISVNGGATTRGRHVRTRRSVRHKKRRSSKWSQAVAMSRPAPSRKSRATYFKQ
jgi:hypothetical protein